MQRNIPLRIDLLRYRRLGMQIRAFKYELLAFHTRLIDAEFREPAKSPRNGVDSED